MDLKKLSRIADSLRSRIKAVCSGLSEGTAFKALDSRDVIMFYSKTVRQTYIVVPLENSEGWELRQLNSSESIVVGSEDELLEFILDLNGEEVQSLVFLCALHQFFIENPNSFGAREYFKNNPEYLKKVKGREYEGEIIEVTSAVGGRGGGFPDYRELEEMGLTKEEAEYITAKAEYKYFEEIENYKEETLKEHKENGTKIFKTELFPEDDDEFWGRSFSEGPWDDVVGFVKIYDKKPTAEILEKCNIWCEFKELENGFYALYGFDGP